MSASFKLFQTMLRCAKDYNYNNTLEWGEKKTYGQMAEDMANKLLEMGYCIRSIDGDIAEDTSCLDDESNFTGE